MIVKMASNRSIFLNTIKADLELPVSKTTIWCVVNNDQNLKLMKKKKKPRLTEQHRVLRTSWANEHIHWKSEWDRVLFSVEKKFYRDGPDGYCHYWHFEDCTTNFL
jgi:hypothetical protein